MYVLTQTPISDVGNSIVSVLKNVCEVTTTKKDDGSFKVYYKLKYTKQICAPRTYSSEYTEDEVIEDFYQTFVRDLVKVNGYVLFKSVN